MIIQVGFEKENRLLQDDENEKLADISSMPPLEGDEDIKEGERLKILTPNKTINQTSNIISTNKS